MHAYPDLFAAMQEYAFCSVVERYAEGEHKRVKHAQQRGLSLAKPAYTCARMRYPQIAKMLDTPEGMDFAVQSWNMCLFKPLLQHKFNDAEIAQLSMARMPPKKRISGRYPPGSRKRSAGDRRPSGWQAYNARLEREAVHSTTCITMRVCIASIVGHTLRNCKRRALTRADANAFES